MSAYSIEECKMQVYLDNRYYVFRRAPKQSLNLICERTNYRDTRLRLEEPQRALNYLMQLTDINRSWCTPPVADWWVPVEEGSKGF